MGQFFPTEDSVTIDHLDLNSIDCSLVSIEDGYVALLAITHTLTFLHSSRRDTNKNDSSLEDLLSNKGANIDGLTRAISMVAGHIEFHKDNIAHAVRSAMKENKEEGS